MSKNAPDTRNKLESIKTGKPKRSGYKKRSNSRKTTLADIKSSNSKDAIKLKLEKKPTKGEIYKEQYGISKTQKRLFKKHGILYSGTAMSEYKTIRKNRKLKERKLRQTKHSTSVAFKRLNGKKKGGKGQPAKKATSK